MSLFTEYLATALYTSDGVTTTYPFSFKGAKPSSGELPYLDLSHIKVYKVDGATFTPLSFTMPTSSSIELSAVQPEGTSLMIRRETPADYNSVKWLNNTVPFDKANLEAMQRQLLFTMQETADLNRYRGDATGHKGDTGATGPKGDTGATGPKGDTGEPGASAYDVAVANGFVGTEEEWLDSLQSFTQAVAGATESTIKSKLLEIVSRADLGDGERRTLLQVLSGSASSDAWLTNPDYNKVFPGAPCASVISGGSAVDPHLIGYGYNRYEWEALGKTLTIPYAVSDKTKLLVRRIGATGIQTTLAEGPGAGKYTVAITPAGANSPGQTLLTLYDGAVAPEDITLQTGERCSVEDQGRVVATCGRVLTIPFVVADTATVVVTRKTLATGVVDVVSSRQYSVAVSGGNTVVTLTADPTSGYTYSVQAVSGGPVFATVGVIPGYSSIGSGGYDCQVYADLMNHLRGAHHRIFAGNHNSIFGGSYGTIWDGTYGIILGGTQHEVGPGASNGAGVIGGIRSRARAQGAGSVFSAESDVYGAWAIAVGGYRIKIAGTGTGAGGRESSYYGAYSWGWGYNNTSYGDYTYVFGNKNTVATQHHHSRIGGGYNLTTMWPGEVISFGYRDTENSGLPYIKATQVHLRKVTTGTIAGQLATLGIGTGGSPPPPATDFTPASGQIWCCSLYVVARTGALKGGSWKVEYTCQNVSGTVSVLGTPTVVALGQDPQLGTAGNAASISVSVVSNKVTLNVIPRADTPVTTKWYGVLDIREVN